MIITKITLHNFGIYAGRHEIDISPRSDRPIILFGALNGSGKTTLLEAIQFALFGRFAKFLGKGKSNYQDFLHNSINRKSLQNSASVAVSFKTRKGSEHQNYEVVRTWSLSNSASNSDEIQVFTNGVLDTELSERWPELSENFFPSQLSDLFFFDGERIESLAQPARCSELIKTGLNSLLGLDVVTDLKKTLVSLERRIKIEGITPAEQEKLLRLDEKKSVITKQLITLEKELSEVSLVQSDLYRDLNLLKNELKLQGGDLYEKRDELSQRHVQIVADISQKRKELVELASSSLPLLLIPAIFKNLEHLSTTSLSIEQKEAVRDALSNFSQSILKEISNQSLLEEKKFSTIVELHSTYLNIDSDKSSRPNIEISKDGLARTRTEGVMLRGTALKQILHLGSLEAELEKIERQLLAVPDASKLGPLLSRMKAMEDQTLEQELLANSLSLQIQRLEKEKEASDTQHNSVSIELLKKQAQDVLNERMRFQLVRGREVLSRFEEKIRYKHLANLEKLILEGFLQLLRKKSFVQSISIEPVNFSLTIGIVGEGDVPASKLSAGERQLLAVAVLWALARASGRKLPTVIDTPLSRLDSKHRKQFVQNYFPNAGEQVILLSTDEEIVGPYYRSVKKHTAKEYLIEYDETHQCSRVIEGYFNDIKEPI